MTSNLVSKTGVLNIKYTQSILMQFSTAEWRKGWIQKKKIGEKLHMYKCRKNCNSDHFVPFKIVLIPHLLTDFLSIHLYKLAEWRKGWIIKGYCQLFRVWFELLSKSSLFQLERSQFSQTMLAIYGLHSIKKLEKIS